MHPPASRVIHENLPYLLELHADGSVAAAFGPFAPGTEPSLAECSADTRVNDADLLERLSGLLPISPTLPPADDSLAGG